MPTRLPPKRLNSLPQLRSDEEELGISITGNDILKRQCRSNPPSSPEPREPRIKSVDEGPWRPATAVRRLGDVQLPTVRESTADLLAIARTSRMLKRDSGTIENIKNMFSGILKGDIPPPTPPEMRSVACSPLSNWSCMSEDLLEHVSQRIATEQQMVPSSRGRHSSRPSSALVTSRPPSRSIQSRDHIVSPHALSGHTLVDRPPSTSGPSTRKRSDRPKTASTGKRPLSGRPGMTARPVSASAVSRCRSVLSYRGALSETGISLPNRAVEKLVSSYENDKLSRDSCSRQSGSIISNESQQSSPIYQMMRQKIHQGYHDMVRAFEMYDKCSGGTLSREEFSRVLGHFTVCLNKMQIHTLMSRSGMIGAWEADRIPYKTFLKKYLDRGRRGYVGHPAADRPQTGDMTNLAETRLIAQLHSDFVDVLENFRSHDKDDTGCVVYSDFKSIMSGYGLEVPPFKEDDRVNYVDYLNSVAQMPPDTPQSSVRPETAPAKMALSHAYTSGEENSDIEFQQLSLNLRPVHKDPRNMALVKIENCKLIKGGTRRPCRPQVGATIQGQLNRKFGNNKNELRRLMQHYDTARDGHITIGTFRDLLREFNISVDENDFYNVLNTYDTTLRGVLPYKKLINSPVNA